MTTASPTKTATPTAPATTKKSTGKRKMVNGEVVELSGEQIEAFGRELDAIRRRVLEDRGEHDANYIRRVIKVQRGLEVSGRGLLWFGWLPPAWVAGTAALSVSKILDNMEIGHNVMHGQFDWMNDPKLTSKGF